MSASVPSIEKQQQLQHILSELLLLITQKYVSINVFDDLFKTKGKCILFSTVGAAIRAIAMLRKVADKQICITRKDMAKFLKQASLVRDLDEEISVLRSGDEIDLLVAKEYDLWGKGTTILYWQIGYGNGHFRKLFTILRSITTASTIETLYERATEEALDRCNKLIKELVSKSEQANAVLQYQKKQCRNCENIPRFKCGQCKFARYCSQKCQATHWKSHKDLCNLERIMARHLLQKAELK